MKTVIKNSLLTTTFVLAALSVNAQSTLSEFADAGDKAYNDGDYAKAVEFYEQAQALDTDNIDFTTAFNLGMAYEKLEKNEQALNSYKSSLIKGNFDKSLFNRMKSNATAMKCNSCLITAYKEIEAAMPGMKESVNEKLFFVYAAEKQTKEAIASCYAVLEENPENFQILKNLGMTYTGINKVDSAVIFLDRAYNIRPEDAQVNRALGICYNNQYENKIAYENKVYERSNKDRSSYNTMMYNRQNAARTFYPKAIKHLDEANATLNDPEVAKLSARLKEALKAYQK